PGLLWQIASLSAPQSVLPDRRSILRGVAFYPNQSLRVNRFKMPFPWGTTRSVGHGPHERFVLARLFLQSTDSIAFTKNANDVEWCQEKHRTSVMHQDCTGRTKTVAIG